MIEKQLLKLIQQANQEALKSGQTLDIGKISRILEEKVRSLNGGPLLNVYRSDRRTSLNLTALNDMLKNIEFDINLIYETMYEKFAEILNRYNSIDISYKAQRSQLNYINALADDLLFNLKNADDNFYGIFDSFATVDKIDLNNTTEGCIDLSEGCISLPYSSPSATRLNMQHMSIVKSGFLQTNTKTNGKIIESKSIIGSEVGQAFTDINNSWKHVVTTQNNDGIVITLTFPVRKDGEPSEITRVEIAAIASDGLTVDLRGSLDNQNFTRFQGAEPKKVLSETDKVAWDFSNSTVRYIRLIFNIDLPAESTKTSVYKDIFTNPLLPGFNDGTVIDAWVYNLIVSNISLYKLGRSQDAIVQTKALKPIDLVASPINSVSLYTEEETPSQTSIDYEIALCDEDNELLSEFISITPQNRQDGTAPKVINFGDQVIDSFTFSLNSGDVATGSVINYKANKLYPVYSMPVDRDYRFGSAKLIRGDNVFSKYTNDRKTIRSIADNYIDFSDGIKTKSLYTFSEETAIPINRYISSTSIKTFIKVDGPIIRSNRNIRDPINDPPSGVDSEPDYAIASIKHLRPTMVVSNDQITPTGSGVMVNGVTIPVAGSWLGSTTSSPSIGVPILLNGQPIDLKPETVELRYISSTTSLVHIFREGIDYSVKRSDDSYFSNFAGWNQQPLHWRIVPAEASTIIIQSGSPLSGVFSGTGTYTYSFGKLPPVTLGSESLTSAQTLRISYEIDSDITHRAIDVSYSSNEIELDGLIQLFPGDSIIVNYRKAPSRLMRDSILVTSKPGSTDKGVIYKEGIDYTIDIVNSEITMNQGGDINKSPSPIVYVDYSYEETVEELFRYSITCYYDSKEPIKFIYNDMNLKVGSGEQFLMTYFDGKTYQTIRLDNKKEFQLIKGWYTFDVLSLDPDKFNDCGIIKVLKLRDIQSRVLFLRRDIGGVFFAEMNGFGKPLTQVTYVELKNTTLKSDHTKFAIDSSNRVVVNFPPAYTDDLYMYQVNSSGVISAKTDEDFRLKITRYLIIESDDNQGYIILRARLSRAQNSPGGKTPKIHSYNLRMAY